MITDEIKNTDLNKLLEMGAFKCSCGKVHSADTKYAVIKKNALGILPELVNELRCKKPFLLSGKDTFAAAGEHVCDILNAAGMDFSQYVFPASPVLPSEFSVGSALMHFDYSCDVVIGIGSGVINDLGKILSRVSNRPYIIVATAPSMDGYASATSSMEREGLKVSLDSKSPWAIVGDLDILCNAPLHLIRSGVDDMLAKYISLAEWKIANIVVNEYYCPVIAGMVENALNKVVSAAPGLMKREPDGVKAVMEGMVIAGLAMKYAGLSRPASGMEHYFSHIWDMRALAFENVKSDLHGIQCGIGTLLSIKIYEHLKNTEPNTEKALRQAADFSVADWNRKLTEFIGPGAKAMIEGEAREKKYDIEKHKHRLNVITDNWPSIKKVINEIPSYRKVCNLMENIGCPTDAHYLGYSNEDLYTCFTMTKDIRDKYVGSRIAWDLGIIDEFRDVLAD